MGQVLSGGSEAAAEQDKTIAQGVDSDVNSDTIEAKDLQETASKAEQEKQEDNTFHDAIEKEPSNAVSISAEPTFKGSSKSTSDDQQRNSKAREDAEVKPSKASNKYISEKPKDSDDAVQLAVDAAGVAPVPTIPTVIPIVVTSNHGLTVGVAVE